MNAPRINVERTAPGLGPVCVVPGCGRSTVEESWLVSRLEGGRERIIVDGACHVCAQFVAEYTASEHEAQQEDRT